MLSSFKDAKPRWGVLILMNSSTCQFENAQGKQIKEDGFVYMPSFYDSKLPPFLSDYAFEVKDGN